MAERAHRRRDRAARTRNSGVDRVEWQLNSGPLQSSNASSFQITIGTHGEHTLRTRVVDEAGNSTPWTDRHVKVAIVGPADTTVIPAGWITDPATVVNVTAQDNGGNGIQRIEWELDDTTSGSALGVTSTPVNITGDGVHKLEVRIIDNLDRVNDWHTHLRQDRHGQPGRQHDRRGRLAPARPPRRARARHRRRTRRSRASSGASTAATSSTPPRTTTKSASPATACTPWRPGSSTTPAAAAPGAVHTIKLDAGLPTNTTPVAPTGWRNTPYSVVLNGTDGLSGVASVNYTIQLDGQPEGDEHEGTRNVTRVDLEDDGAHILRTRVATTPATTRRGAPRRSASTASRRPTTPSIRRAPVGNRHIVTFVPDDDRSGVAGVEWKLDDGVVKTTPDGPDHRRGRAHALRPRAGQRRQLERLGRIIRSPSSSASTRSPRPTRPSIPSAWQLVAYTVTVDATDDIDGIGVDYVEWRVRPQPDGPGPDRQPVHDHRGRRTRDRDARDRQGRQRVRRGSARRCGRHAPSRPTTTAMRGPLDELEHVHARRDRRDVGCRQPRVQDRQRRPIAATGGTDGHASRPTAPTGSPPRSRQRRPASGWKVDEFTVDTVVAREHERRGPDHVADDLAVARADRHRRRARASITPSGASTAARSRRGSAAAVATEGTQTLETRIVDKAGNASAWRSETIRVDHTKPVNTTAR